MGVGAEDDAESEPFQRGDAAVHVGTLEDGAGRGDNADGHAGLQAGREQTTSHPKHLHE